MLTWTADAELSANITIGLFIYLCMYVRMYLFIYLHQKKRETFQFFGVRDRFGHIECPVIKQSKLRHQP